MKFSRDNGLSERRGTATDAKAAQLAAFRAAREAALPNLEARQAERVAIAEARNQRRAEREDMKAAEQAAIKAAAEEREAAAELAARAEADARALAENSRISRVVEDEAARKAERDRRYAARKARQR